MAEGLGDGGVSRSTRGNTPVTDRHVHGNDIRPLTCK